jgi:hypothetical protein
MLPPVADCANIDMLEACRTSRAAIFILSVARDQHEGYLIFIVSDHRQSRKA